ncbi:hypothetical protein MCEMSE15_00026 [Fimbriimonadaceae bacterium]
MKFKSLMVFGLIVTANVGSAITWCHDYTLYRASQFATGKGKDFNNMDPMGLKSRLTALGYSLAFMARPGDSQALQAGDVIIIGNASEGQPEDHSGFVTDNEGHIDHLIQMFGSSGMPRDVSQIANVMDPAFGEPLLRRGWTISDLRDRKRTVNGVSSDSIYKNKTFQIFRRARLMTDEVNVWTSTAANPEPVGTLPKISPTVNWKLGTIQYVNATNNRIQIEFTLPPNIILDGEEVQLKAEIRHQASNAYAPDQFKLDIGGNVKKPRPLHGGIFADPTQYSVAVSLNDPEAALVTFSTPDGRKIKDAAPAKGEVRFPWPKFVPNEVIEYRDLSLRLSGVGTYRLRYQRQNMKLRDALTLKFPDMK